MILVIDDDLAIQASLKLLFTEEDYKVAVAGKQGEALRILKAESVSLILMDMNFSVETSGRDGLELLADVKEFWPKIPVILITGWGSIELAVKGMRGGAFDFITKPWQNSRILSAVSNALALSAKEKQRKETRKSLDKKYNFKEIIGEHPKMLSVLKTTARVAPTTATVLIQGESGTGKELIARAIHENSKRKNEAFVSVNLGAVPENLFESEMFGYRKGAFTDAQNDKPGRFELANGGTLFLDEIGETSLNAQVKLLRVLQEQQLERVGDTCSVNIDVRIVCATNRNLAKMVEDGTFREDLFYRINLINVHLPTLRERNSDIPVLAEYFLKSLTAQYNLPEILFDKAALSFLKNKNFPGNIRELKNLVERSVLSCDEKIIAKEFLEKQLQSTVSPKSENNLPEVGSMTLDQIEKAMVIKALQKYNHNISQAATSLGLSRQMLYRRMEKYNIENQKQDEV